MINRLNYVLGKASSANYNIQYLVSLQPQKNAQKFILRPTRNMLIHSWVYNDVTCIDKNLIVGAIVDETCPRTLGNAVMENRWWSVYFSDAVQENYRGQPLNQLSFEMRTSSAPHFTNIPRGTNRVLLVRCENSTYTPHNRSDYFPPNHKFPQYDTVSLVEQGVHVVYNRIAHH